jgi:hypothetical protein
MEAAARPMDTVALHQRTVKLPADAKMAAILQLLQEVTQAPQLPVSLSLVLQHQQFLLGLLQPLQ